MKILVIGGTGQVGSQLVPELVARGQEVHVLTRDPSNAKPLPDEVRVHQGDLVEPKTIREVFRGMDRVFLLNPVSPTETHEALMAVNGAMLGEVGRVVYLTVYNVDRAPHLPHFGSKLAAEIALQQSGVPYTILRPNNFFQNDEWLKQALLEYGVYPQPLGEVGVSRVDVRDIAEIAAVTLTTDGHEGKVYSPVGPRALTGPQCAEIWSRALERKIAYGGDDMDAWERQNLEYMRATLVFDFRRMFEYFQTDGMVASAEEVATTSAILGRAPRDYESYVQERAAEWTEAAVR